MKPTNLQITTLLATFHFILTKRQNGLIYVLQHKVKLRPVRVVREEGLSVGCRKYKPQVQNRRCATLNRKADAFYRPNGRLVRDTESAGDDVWMELKSKKNEVSSA
jgi:hypothetical protein